MTQLQRIAISPDQMQDGQILLTSSQQHYLVRVLRLQEGDRLIAMDGKGKWWLAQLVGEQAQVVEPLTPETELPIAITLMVALPKGNSFDEVLRACTELGVTCFQLVMSQRTLLNPSPKKLERWRRIAQEAAEQSERALVPTILEPVSFNTAIATCTATHRYICEARGNLPHLQGVISAEVNRVSTAEEIAIAIGPEGGWTETEVEDAIKLGFKPVSLGRRILRAVTAPIVALSVVAGELESVQ